MSAEIQSCSFWQFYVNIVEMFPFFTIFFIRHQHTLLCHVNQNERQLSLKHTSEPRGAVVCGLSLFFKKAKKTATRKHANTYLSPKCFVYLYSIFWDLRKNKSTWGSDNTKKTKCEYWNWPKNWTELDSLDTVEEQSLVLA